MNELMEKVENLMTELDSSSLVTSIRELQAEVEADLELSSMVEEYSIYPREELKSKIVDNPTFQKYKIKETELNLFIMEINQRLKVIHNKGKCQK